METLNDLLNLDLNKCSIFDITEEHLILLKTKDFHTQNNFYFYLYNKLTSIEKTKKKGTCLLQLSYILLFIYSNDTLML